MNLLKLKVDLFFKILHVNFLGPEPILKSENKNKNFTYFFVYCLPLLKLIPAFSTKQKRRKISSAPLNLLAQFICIEIQFPDGSVLHDAKYSHPCDAFPFLPLRQVSKQYPKNV